MIDPSDSADRATADIIALATGNLRRAQDEVTRWTNFLSMVEQITTSKPRRRVRPKISPILDATEAIVASILRELGPQRTTDLVRLLKQKGHEVSGDQPSATLDSRLKRATSIERIPRKGWRLKEDAAVPEAQP